VTDVGTGEDLVVERAAAVAVITLNRPRNRNALTAHLIRSLRAAMADADADDTVGAVILTGTDPAFCAGLDLGEVADTGENLRLAEADGDPTAPPVGHPWTPLGKPVIGAINGVAITGGFELALHCDILIASENAAFADTHVRVGVLPGWGMSVLLPRAVGAGRALRMSLTGEFLDAAAALRYGLVTEVVPHAGLLAAAHRVAHGVLGADPATCAAYLASVRRIADLDTGDAFRAEAEAARNWLDRSFDPAGVASRRAGIVAGNRGALAEKPAAPAP
jgi:enoyl-CoA hydratase